jgi:crossover junction endodeoxyribonuclease RuvC
VIVIGIDPGLTGAISVFDGDGTLLEVHDMPQQVKSTKRVRNGRGEMVDRHSWEVDAAAFGTIIHPGKFVEPVRVYIEQVGAVYRQDKQRGTEAHQPLHATFVFGEGFGVLRGVCEAYYGKGNLIRVMPAVWKKHHGLLKTEKDMARIRAIELLPDAADKLKRKKDIGRADASLIGLYGVHKEREVS